MYQVIKKYHQNTLNRGKTERSHRTNDNIHEAIGDALDWLSQLVENDYDERAQELKEDYVTDCGDFTIEIENI